MIKYQGISTLEVLEEAKNYNNWIASRILPHLKAPVLEIGAGTGNLTKHFTHIKPLHISDKDEGLVRHLKNKFQKEKDLYVDLLNVENTAPKKLKNAFSGIYAINVLEHIQDDEKALVNIHSLLKDDGKLVLLVPAKKTAYTRLDKELGHFRRYEKKELLKKLENANYKIEKIYFFNIVGLISWYVRDKVKRNNVHLKPYHISIFDSIVPYLRLAETVIRIPVGISLIVVASKK